jgi:hypothetical protein
MFQNTSLARSSWTGLNDEHLASIGFVSFAWSALERKFASLVWATAGWSQEIGELVTSDLGNVSLAALFLNLLKQTLRERPDALILEQGVKTAAVFDGGDSANNINGHFNLTKKRSDTGEVEITTVVMSKQDIDVLCFAISACSDAIDDLTHKLLFRRRFLASKTSGNTYEQTVHGWQDPSFDIERLQTFLEARSQRPNPRKDQPPPRSSRASQPHRQDRKKKRKKLRGRYGILPKHRLRPNNTLDLGAGNHN